VMPGPFERNRFLALEIKEGWLDGAAGMLVPSGRKLALPPLRRAA
jgi:predicted N-acetyltransferase YhbS